MEIHRKALFLLILMMMLLAFDCHRSDSRWKGKIEKIDGITTAKNPKEPMFEEDEGVFKLREDLSIGVKEGSPEYMFSQVQDLDVDAEGNIYVLDQKETRVIVFDAQGIYLRTIGRRGQGPGEVQLPIFVQITARNELLVYDYAMTRAVFYTREGIFLRHQSTRRPLVPIALDSRGILVGFEILAPPPLGGKLLKIYDRDFQKAKVIAQDEQGQAGVIDVGQPTIYACIAPVDTIVWGNSENYTLYVANSAGETIKIIRREYDPVPITSMAKKEFEEKYAEPVRYGMRLSFRNNFPAFSGIFVDEDGHIFVKTYETAARENDRYMFDIFDPEGRYIAKVVIKANLNERSVWKKDRLYTIEMDELDYPAVVRYQVTWKE
jgi:hypothetical protein